MFTPLSTDRPVAIHPHNTLSGWMQHISKQNSQDNNNDNCNNNNNHHRPIVAWNT
jgi:hypothetical protein